MTDEDVKLIEKFIDIRNRGYYCNGAELTEVYNRVLGKAARPTNCGSCIRGRINELATALNSFKAMIAKQEEENLSTALETTSTANVESKPKPRKRKEK